MARGDSVNSIIGEGSSFEGKFYISGSLKINGRFEGDIRTDDALLIGKSGKVKTNIMAREVVLAGTMLGNVVASEIVTLSESCKMLGDIKTPLLDVNEGVIYKGNVTITGNSKHEPDKFIEESYASRAHDKKV